MMIVDFTDLAPMQKWKLKRDILWYLNCEISSISVSIRDMDAAHPKEENEESEVYQSFHKWKLAAQKIVQDLQNCPTN